MKTQVQKYQYYVDTSTNKVIYDNELEDMFNDLLDDTTPVIEILGFSYSPSRVLKEVDPIAYNEEFSNWLDNECSEGVFEAVELTIKQAQAKR
mgnify:CR=1 FL=1